MRKLAALLCLLLAGVCTATPAFTAPDWRVEVLNSANHMWHVVGTVFNKGDTAGKARVRMRIVDPDNGDKVVGMRQATVFPNPVAPRTDGAFEIQFGYPGDATRLRYEVELEPEK